MRISLLDSNKRGNSLKSTHTYGGGSSPSAQTYSYGGGSSPAAQTYSYGGGLSPSDKAHLPLPAIELIVKAAGLKPRRMEGVHLPTSSNGINEQSGWTEAQPYEAYSSPSEQQI